MQRLERAHGHVVGLKGQRARVRLVQFAAILHDIGKIGIRGEIIRKESELTAEEYSIIKRHPEIGEQIISAIDFLQEARIYIKYHHERYDGKGYPEGLAGEKIPVVARIICVADTVDAMYSARVYRHEMDLDYVKSELVRCSGTQFDPLFAQDMLKVLSRGYKAKDVLEPVDLIEDPEDLAAFISQSEEHKDGAGSPV